ncbi:universal stress protein [Variovorax sp. J22R133]|uniref:universal stress protein n=1 Tax=Variovorax brevis TaxID=3053503 RepID=UPI002576AAA1|nr:universal stress protein [Variovorax sp. J22R133]MDM0116361.1 universal stress protein [Variovorax sp. J22R133]
MYQRILVPLDGSETSTRGVDEAIRLARLTGGKLRFLHVIDELSFALAVDSYAGFTNDLLAALRENGEELLESAKSSARKAGVESDSVLYDSFNGRMVDFVTRQAREWPADLIVLGTHGRRGVRRLMLGSGAESILRSAPVPVLLVRAKEQAATDDAPQVAEHVTLPSAALSME